MNGHRYSDLRNANECWGSTSNPILNGHLHYPRDDIGRPLNEAAPDKIRDYRYDYNNLIIIKTYVCPLYRIECNG